MVTRKTKEKLEKEVKTEEGGKKLSKYFHVQLT